MCLEISFGNALVFTDARHDVFRLGIHGNWRKHDETGRFSCNNSEEVSFGEFQVFMNQAEERIITVFPWLNYHLWEVQYCYR